MLVAVGDKPDLFCATENKRSPVAKFGPFGGGETRTTLGQTQVSIVTQEPAPIPLTEPLNNGPAVRILLRPVK